MSELTLELHANLWSFQCLVDEGTNLFDKMFHFCRSTSRIFIAAIEILEPAHRVSCSV